MNSHGVNSALGLLAIIVLLAGLVVMVPQIAELVTQIDVVAEHVGTFTSPISLPGWANTALPVQGSSQRSNARSPCATTG